MLITVAVKDRDRKFKISDELQFTLEHTTNPIVTLKLPQNEKTYYTLNKNNSILHISYV